MDLNNIFINSWKVIKKAIVVDITVVILSIILWGLWGKSAAVSMADIVFILGSITAGCGAYFVIGAKIGSVDYIYSQSRPASQINYHDRLGQEIEYIYKSYYDATIFLIAGLLAIGESIIVYNIIG
jgi:hypothetical protein